MKRLRVSTWCENLRKFLTSFLTIATSGFSFELPVLVSRSRLFANAWQTDFRESVQKYFLLSASFRSIFSLSVLALFFSLSHVLLLLLLLRPSFVLSSRSSSSPSPVFTSSSFLSESASNFGSVHSPSIFSLSNWDQYNKTYFAVTTTRCH